MVPAEPAAERCAVQSVVAAVVVVAAIEPGCFGTVSAPSEGLPVFEVAAAVVEVIAVVAVALAAVLAHLVGPQSAAW